MQLVKVGYYEFLVYVSSKRTCCSTITRTNVRPLPLDCDVPFNLSNVGFRHMLYVWLHAGLRK